MLNAAKRRASSAAVFIVRGINGGACQNWVGTFISSCKLLSGLHPCTEVFRTKLCTVRSIQYLLKQRMALNVFASLSFHHISGKP